jgi:hypothetical protein
VACLRAAERRWPSASSASSTPHGELSKQLG